VNLDDFDAHRAMITTASGPISYVDVGTGRAALFVHGVGTNGYLWRHVIGALGPQQRAIALDLPLHGRSPAAPGQDFSLNGLARVVRDFCDALSLDDVDLIANDTGGAVAQVFAAGTPERLRTLTLTNCDTHDNLPPEAFAPTVELARSGALSALAPQLLSDMDLARASAFGTAYEHPEALSAEMVHAYLDPVLGTPERAHEFERWIIGLEAGELLAVEPALEQLTVPTLVVWGTGDPNFEVKWAYWLRDTIPGVVDVVELPGARLFFPEERASELVPLLRRHWASY
jgi:pimeloyl-ACP methyl ester carboxylesterase